MTTLKFRSLFLLLFFQCYLGYAIKGEVANDHPAIHSIEKLDTGNSNGSAKEETDLPMQKSPDHQPNSNEPLKLAKISDHENYESQTNLTEDLTNKTTDQSNNHNQTMHSKIGVRGGKTGGSKVGGSKGGGTKTKIGGGRGSYWRPSTRSGGGGGSDLMELWVILGIIGVCGGGFLVFYLYAKYAGSNGTEEQQFQSEITITKV